MVRLNRGSHSFKLGVLAGVFLFLFLECFVGLLTTQDFRILRFVLMLLFAAGGVASTLAAYRKI